jgi:hypothetical protein
MAKTPTEIKSLARVHTDAAIKCLVGIMKNSTSDPAKVAAANSLIDRGWGKAEQRLEAEHIVRYVADVPAVAETTEQWQQQHAPTTLQ